MVQTTQPKTNRDDVLLYGSWQKSPIKFVEDMWQLKAQPLKAEYSERFKILAESRDSNWSKEVSDEWFMPFTKGKNITWQQLILLTAIERALKGLDKRRITVESGHGTGKSTTLSWLIIWFLFCFKDAQIPCTAPTSSQMHDVLWKELSKWIQKLKPEIKAKFLWTSEYLRISESPETWFARAKTAKKEAPEALAGMHGDFVMFVIDESSGVPEEVFNTAEGALTQENILVVMISNHTRLVGYFHNSHTSDAKNWQRLSFNSEQSPIVDRQFVDRIVEKHGKDSDEYKIRVKGTSPNEEGMDDKGFVPLFSEHEIHFVSERPFIGITRLGIDPSGEGQDVTAWLARDNFVIKVIGKEIISNPKSIASKSMTWMTQENIKDENVMIDNFGVGADVSKEMALSDSRYNVGTVNVGQKPEDEIYLNLRAEAFFRLHLWFKNGGKIIDNPSGREFAKELLYIKFRRNEAGKIQIMSKQEMRKQGFASPNFADGAMLTFVKTAPIRMDAIQTGGVAPMYPDLF